MREAYRKFQNKFKIRRFPFLIPYKNMKNDARAKRSCMTLEDAGISNSPIISSPFLGFWLTAPYKGHPAHSLNKSNWRSPYPPFRKCPRLWRYILPSLPKLTPQFAPSTFSSRTKYFPCILENFTHFRSSAPACSREPSRCLP